MNRLPCISTSNVFPWLPVSRSASIRTLARAPIVEVAVDIDRDLPVGFDLTAVEESAKEIFADP